MTCKSSHLLICVFDESCLVYSNWFYLLSDGGASADAKRTVSRAAPAASSTASGTATVTAKASQHPPKATGGAAKGGKRARANKVRFCLLIL